MAAGLTGCASGPLASLASFTAGDVDQAIAMATTATDAGAPYRLRCYQTLKKYVGAFGNVQAPALPKGVVSGYELAAELDAKVRGAGSAIPADLHADCAVLTVNTLEFAARLGAKVAPIPGAGVVGDLLR